MQKIKKVKALTIALRTIERIVERGKVMKNVWGKYQRTQNHFSKIFESIYFDKKFMIFTKIELNQC